MQQIKPFAGILFFFLLLSVQAGAQTAVKRKEQFNLNSSGVAIKGYDPVAYFTQQKAVKGSSSMAVSHQGVLYYFSTAANKQLFLNSPAKYEPQYGGWCAYAMGNDGSKVSIDPETFKLLDGKLYLFYNSYFTNTLPKWNKNESALKRQADANWQGFIK